MRRALKWIWAPALLAGCLVAMPAKEAKAQSFGYYYSSPRVSIGFSSGYAPSYGYGAPYVGGYCPPRVYRPYAYGPRPHYGHYHGHGHAHRGPGRRW
jgi:hypothetical protein